MTTTGELVLPFFTGVAAPVLLYWLTRGAVDVWKAYKARKAGVSGDERQARMDHEQYLEARCEHAESERDYYRRRTNVLDDYAHELREQVTELGGKPKPWPVLEMRRRAGE